MKQKGFTRFTKSTGSCVAPGGIGLAPRNAPGASAFLATPGRFAGTIKRHRLATVAYKTKCAPSNALIDALNRSNTPAVGPLKLLSLLTVGLVQMSMSPDPRENLARASALVAEATDKGAKLVCVPELFSWRYFCQSEDPANFALAEPVPGPTTRALKALAADLDLVLAGGVFERRAPGIYHNTAVFIDGRRGYVGKYRKMHIPDDPGYHEKFYFTLGDLGFRSFGSRCGECGLMLCWDQWYPEAACSRGRRATPKKW